MIIVGGTTGSGRELVRRLSQRQSTISLLARHPSTEVEQHCPGVRFFPVDLSDQGSIVAAVDQCLASGGKVDHLVFYQRYRGQDDAWDGEIRVSLTATKTVIEQCADRFGNGADHSIVVVSSVSSRFICSEQPVGYHMAKAAISQMVRYYAVVLGPRGIRVNAVCPDTVVKEESREFYERNHDLRNLNESIIPLGRMGTSEDVANVVQFLCSPQASFITGQEIVVDGGLSLLGQGAMARRVAHLDQLKITR